MLNTNALPPVVRERPARALVLIDGSSVLGGSLASYSIHENLRRAVSQETGKECQGTVMIFADVAHLASSLRIPAEILAQFARGFSSTSAPSIFSNVPQSNIVSVMNSHLVFQARAVDYVFLAGWNTDMHAHWLKRLVPTTVSSHAHFFLIESGRPIAASLGTLVPRKVRFLGLMDVVPVQAVKDVTDPPSDAEESDGLDAGTLVGPPSTQQQEQRSGASTAPPLTARNFTSLLLNRNPPPSAAPSPLAAPVHIAAPVPVVPALASIADFALPPRPLLNRSNTGSTDSAQSQKTVPTSPSSQRATPKPQSSRPSPVSQEHGSVASQPPAEPPTPAPEPAPSPPASHAPSAPLPRDPSPTSTSAAAPAGAAPVAASTSTSAPLTLPRPPAVPTQYQPLLRVLVALSAPQPGTGAVPPAPLWSTVGSELQRLGADGAEGGGGGGGGAGGSARYGKLATYIQGAQRAGWVQTGRRSEAEGSEWVRISQRGARAMGKLKGASGPK
ncbi:hypothetical protein Rhopal_002152-T1 [Rhodotorula paludigena]|uniref:NYN domain-containing protein n=1 Tax=Rhodotorula paludigena TaxID=86838 RepID=A0AAV5GG95_9BASI|nr:hypothetical protein Rhopal_002152-T1 [Rhodotorula paludigena]